MSDDYAPLTIDLSGRQGHALLTVEPPPEQASKPVEFEVPPLNSSSAEDQLVRISTQVVFTTAVNERDGWKTWHVKIYRCATVGDTDTLCQHLHRQAAALQQVNNFLPGQRGRAFEPPWAVVPVQVVRGDGRLEQLAGAVTTRLGVPSDQIVARLRRHLPGWLDGSTAPECILLAVSPQIDPLDWRGREHGEARPDSEHLETFETLAAGLDLLHQQSWAHCDIKPDNVCRCSFGQHTALVLIDTDAATRTSPAPKVLRTTDLYDYRALRDRRLGRAQGPLRPGHLYAQDRFGLLLVVLSLVAGREWVEQVVLAVDATDASGGRIADSEEKMHRALTALWPDPRWEPLIRVLAEPFGVGVDGQIALERPDPWAAAWLGRVRAAEEQCVEPAAPARDDLPAPPPVAVRAVEDVRRAARARPAGRHELVRRAYEAIEQAAQDLAAGQARRAMWLWGGGLTAAGFLIALDVFVFGR